MKFTIDLSQREYYKKNGFLPLSHVLNAEELEAINQGIDEIYSAKKLKKETPTLETGRDLFRKSELVKKIIFSKRVTALTFDLLQKKPIRLAFDQVFIERSSTLKDEPSSYGDEFPFEAHSAIKPLLCLLMLSLKSTEKNDSDLPFTKVLEAGNGCFFSPSTPFPFTTIAPSSSHRFVLIGYTSSFTQYIFEPRDPIGYFLKSLGYVYGDKLNDNLHPVLLR